MAILPICRYADIGASRYADIADIFQIQIHRKRGGFGFKSGFEIFCFNHTPTNFHFPQVHVLQMYETCTLYFYEWNIRAYSIDTY